MIERADFDKFCSRTPEEIKQAVRPAAAQWVEVKERGGRVVVATGSGPHLHEGVSCLLAGMIEAGLVDGVLTSAAMVAHEMAGTLEWVKRVDGQEVGLSGHLLPADGRFEVCVWDDAAWAAAADEIDLDDDLVAALRSAPGHQIIKVAGNLAYPSGLRAERLAREICPLAAGRDQTLELAVGPGADPLTMIGAGARAKAPVMVTTPQLVGGGAVGLAVAESISATERSRRVAEILAGADLVVESGLALAQEIHDGPFETFTGHGLWAAFEGQKTFSLADKRFVRIDLDPTLEAVVRAQRDKAAVSEAIHQGRPKAKTLDVPFRMEMSGFARLPRASVIQADLAVVWPLLAGEVAGRLGVELPFYSLPQETNPGAAMRAWIAANVRPVDRDRVLAAFETA
ncbi:MAG: hypothetical protein KJ621_18845 [Proteobacteria bacterium]|nr:hypothetical protein [Pseudomonadota bacterium]MBU1740364.1 hypothetical protein [Pseudomonadota bacterium]